VTLLELLLVLVLVGILAGIAYPSYRAQVVRSRRLEAIEALLTAAAAQERFYLDRGRYADQFVTGGDDDGLLLPSVTAGGRYQLTLQAPAPSDYVLRARPRAGSGQEDDARCSEFWVRADGRRGAVDRGGGDSTAACWG
jgi:type IV pilus assembly protein PilE